MQPKANAPLACHAVLLEQLRPGVERAVGGSVVGLPRGSQKGRHRGEEVDSPHRLQPRRAGGVLHEAELWSQHCAHRGSALFQKDSILQHAAGVHDSCQLAAGAA